MIEDFDIYDIEFMAAKFIPQPTDNIFLDTRYDWQRYNNGVEWPYYRFFYHLANELKPYLTVELGGYQGSCAAHLAAGWIRGDVISIDHHTDQGDQDNQEKMLECVREVDNLFYLQGWSTPKLALENVDKHALGNARSVYEDISIFTQNAGKIDILFIDSWHIYEHVKADYEAYLLLMNSPGLIIFDDIIDHEKLGDPISGMLRFWRELPECKFLNANLHPGCFMGFLKV